MEKFLDTVTNEIIEIPTSLYNAIRDNAVSDFKSKNRSYKVVAVVAGVSVVALGYHVVKQQQLIYRLKNK